MGELTIEQKKAIALARARVAAGKAKAAPETGIVDQAGSGVNEGLSSFLGLPVDAMTGVMNAMSGPSLVTGEDGRAQFVDDPMIKNPVGGSETFRDMLSPLISETEPQTAGQRYARRIGQEVGFGGPASLAFAGTPAVGKAALESLPAFLAASTAGDVGAGIAGQTAREYDPDNAILDLAASITGGIGGAGMASMMTPRYAPTPTLEATKQKAADAWGRVNASDARLSDAAVADLDARVRGSLPTSQLAPKAYPNAFGLADDVPLMKNPKVSEVEDLRRIIGDAVAGNAQESRVGVNMKKEIADYLAGLKPKDFATGDGTDVIDDLASARDLTARTKRAEAVINKEMRGESRAATSGTGGNEVNAQKQNVRSLFDIERDPTLTARRKGYTPEEMAQMKDVVFGSPGSNAARLVGRLAPTSGALPLVTTGIGGASGATAAMMGGSPFLAIPAIAGGIGIAGKQIAEGMTKSQIKKLIATILAGEAPKTSAARGAGNAAIIEQLLSKSIDAAR